MSGPIVRSGPSPEFSKNWESVFGKPGTAAAAAKKTAKKAAGKKSAKKAPGKKAKKSGK
ncbi:MAG TPA: hypothetical protein VNH11_18425 [Pirellulales bacterium]|nr:hypothetical protein [Pirellulales bacterium]